MTESKFQALRQEVVDNADVMTVTMERLRNDYGTARLGVHVVANIKKALESMGLGTWPEKLPDWHREKVRVYRLGSPVATLIKAVITVDEVHDEEIRRSVTGDDRAVLNTIRELVCS